MQKGCVLCGQYGPKHVKIDENNHYMCQGCLREYAEYETKGELYQVKGMTGTLPQFSQVFCPVYGCSKEIKLLVIESCYTNEEIRFFRQNLAETLEQKPQELANDLHSELVLPKLKDIDAARVATAGECFSCHSATNLIKRFPGCTASCTMRVCVAHQKDAAAAITANSRTSPSTIA
jgi:hypothetical protein